MLFYGLSVVPSLLSYSLFVYWFVKCTCFCIFKKKYYNNMIFSYVLSLIM